MAKNILTNENARTARDRWKAALQVARKTPHIRLGGEAVYLPSLAAVEEYVRSRSYRYDRPHFCVRELPGVNRWKSPLRPWDIQALRDLGSTTGRARVTLDRALSYVAVERGMPTGKSGIAALNAPPNGGKMTKQEMEAEQAKKEAALRDLERLQKDVECATALGGVQRHPDTGGGPIAQTDPMTHALRDEDIVLQVRIRNDLVYVRIEHWHGSGGTLAEVDSIAKGLLNRAKLRRQKLDENTYRYTKLVMPDGVEVV